MIDESLTRNHDRKGFDCGSPELNEFLQRHARQNATKGVAQTYVLVDPDNPETIVGYYSLSAAEIEFERLLKAHRRSLPRYPVPAARMGRLAVDHQHKGSGVGGQLLGLAIRRCQAAREQLGIVVLIVDAKNENAAAFYRHHGFTPVEDDPFTLYIHLDMAE